MSFENFMQKVTTPYWTYWMDQPETWCWCVPSGAGTIRQGPGTFYPDNPGMVNLLWLTLPPQFRKGEDVRRVPGYANMIVQRAVKVQGKRLDEWASETTLQGFANIIFRCNRSQFGDLQDALSRRGIHAHT